MAPEHAAEEWRATFDAIGDAICVLDTSHRVVRCNRAFRELTGVTEEKAVGENCCALVFGAHRENCDCPLRRMSATLRDESGQFDHRGRTFRCTVRPITDGALAVTGAVHVLSDVTEQLRADERLRLFSSALESAATGIVITDSRGDIVFANSAFSKLSGYAFAEVAGRNLRILNSHQQSPDFYSALWQTILSGRVWRGELVNRRKDGTLYNEEMTITPVCDAAGRIVNFIAIKLDITERRKSEATLREHAALLDVAHVGIVVRDMNGTVTFWNKGAEALYGRNSEQAVGRTLDELFADLGQERARLANETVRQIGMWKGDFTFTIHGQRRVIDSDWVLIRDEQGQPKSILSLDGDVTERRRFEEQLSQMQRLQGLGTLVSGIAHDFNNILMPILGLSDFLVATPGALDDREGTLDALRNINDAAKDAREIVRRLREFYRPDESIEMHSINLRLVINDAIRLTQPRWKTQAEAEGKPIRIKPNYGLKSRVIANETQLREVFTNLILNAIDALPAGGTITITTGEHEGSAVVEVADTGIGMDGDTLLHCLEPFFTTKGKHGSGLGLSMCHGIIQRHGGVLTIESQPGRGATVKIRLPLEQLDLPREQPAETEVLSQEAAARRVLVIDDEELARKLVKSFLSAEGYVVETAASGEEGLEKLRAGPFDVVITDRAMPRMNGDQVALEAKRIAPGTPVLMLTGFGGLLVTNQNRPPGVDYVAGKPVTSREIHQILQRLVRERGAT